MGLWIYAAILTRDLVRALHPDASLPRYAFPVAILLSGQFVLNNLNLLQVNLVTFVLCLLGARGLMARRPAAIAWIVVAAAMKITPVFFVIWGVIRGGRRAFGLALAVGIACLVLPLLQRGFALGAADYAAYYGAFLDQFASGKVLTEYTNQNLAAMIYRAVTVPATPERYSYVYLPSLAAAAPLLYRAGAVIVVAGFLGRLFWLARARRPISALEVAGVFLTGHLLSGITWKAHLVTLLYVFYVFLTIDRQPLGRLGRAALGVAYAGMAIIGLVGRDVFGDAAHHYLGGYSAFVWVMLLLLLLTATLDRPSVEASRLPAPA